MRNLTWFGRMRGLITPSNIEDTVRFLDRFQQGIYVVHLSKLQANYEKRYASVGLQPIPLGLEGIFVYGKPAKGKSIKPPL